MIALSRFVFLFAWFSVAMSFGQQDEASARLLQSLLGDVVAEPASAPVPQEGMIVRGYQLTHLKVDAPNALRTADVLRRWLPAGSTVSPVNATNALHVLTTPTAHQGVVELLAAVDASPSATDVEGERNVKDAIEKFATQMPKPEEIRQLVRETLAAQTRETAVAQAELARRHSASQQRLILIIGGAVFALFVIILGALVLMQRKTGKSASSELALAPATVAQALQPFHDHVDQRLELMARDMRSIIKTALQINRQTEAQRGSDLGDLKTQLEAYLMKQNAVLEQSRLEMDRTATRLNASADAIQVSQHKVEALTDQLRGAMHEIDRLQQAISEREEHLEKKTTQLRAKEEEVGEVRNRLAQNLAKVALLAQSLGVDDGDFFNEPLPEFQKFMEGTSLTSDGGPLAAAGPGVAPLARAPAQDAPDLGEIEFRDPHRAA